MLFLLLACVEPRESFFATEANQQNDTDLREDIPDAPEHGITFQSPDFTVPPYTEIMYCYAGTYTGPTVGVNFLQVFQSLPYAHHTLLKVAPSPVQDGVLEDCTYLDGEQEMSELAPMFEAVGIEPEVGFNGNWFNLPEKVAFKLEHNQQWILEMHYVNTSENEILVNSAINLGFISIEEVEGFASPLHLDAGGVEVSPGASTFTFDCEWPMDVNLLSIMGHMHNTGSKFTIEHIKPNGESALIYNVEEWLGGVYPFFPYFENFDPGELEIQAGDVFRTHCEWDNPTQDTLGFPEEMCTVGGVVYPLDTPFTCYEQDHLTR